MKTHCTLITLLAFIAVAILLLVIIQGSLYADKAINTPPDPSSILEQYDTHFSDINTVATFLKEAPYRSIYITDSSGSAWADFSNIQLEQSVFKAVKRLRDSGFYIKFMKSDNVIWFLQWTGTKNISCGIAYSIVKATLPSNEYFTASYEIKDGWYYYISES